MNIAILAAGAGDMYCGSCLRDSATASALKRRGHQVTLVPLYTPVRTDGENVSLPDVFYGGLNVYLQNATGLFRHTPRALDWVLDRPWLLRAAGNWGAQTTPESVADLTAAIIQGEAGSTRKELNRLLDFLKQDVHPQVVSLPNLMFIGMADAIRKTLNVPVICELTGEDIFLDAMSEPNRHRLRAMIRERAGDVTRFISMTDYYANRMAEYMDVSRDRIDVVPTGLASDFLKPVVKRQNSVPTVGYLARICPEKGLDRLLAAMRLVQQMPGLENVKVIGAGYFGARDQKWFNSLKQLFDGTPLKDSFQFLGEVDRAEKIRMLDSIDVFSVPTSYPEAKGIYIIEALARGVPVVQPAHGSFPELINQTGGGVLVPPDDPTALAEAIAGLLRDPARREQLSRAGRAAVEASLTEDQMADRILGVYQALL